LIVTRKRWKKGSAILAAVDLAAESAIKKRLNHKVIQDAAAYASAVGGELHLVHVLHLNPVLTELDLVDHNSYANEHRKAIAPQVAQVIERYGIPKSRIKLRDGPVDKVICSEAARLKAQMVVVGTNSR
jgi:universal stress protein E